MPAGSLAKHNEKCQWRLFNIDSVVVAVSPIDIPFFCRFLLLIPSVAESCPCTPDAMKAQAHRAAAVAASAMRTIIVILMKVWQFQVDGGSCTG